jgi:hypothetical protein
MGLCGSVGAQKVDSVKMPEKKAAIVSYQYEHDFFPARSSYQTADTVLQFAHHYFPGNFQYAFYLTARRLTYTPTSEIGFRSGWDWYNFWGYSRNEIKYFSTRAPFTSIRLVFGQKKEQYSQLFHTQNITQQWNVALSMLRIRSEGFYNRQNAVNNNIYVSTHYTTRNHRYAVLANGIITSMKADENGGLSNDTLYQRNLLIDKKLLPVNLTNANSKRVNKEVTVSQFLNFGKKTTYKVKDSLVRKKIIPAHYFSYSLHAQGLSFLYKDAAGKKYYPNSFFDSITHDSTHVFTMQHAFAWSSYVSKNIAAKITFEKETIKLVQYAKEAVIAFNTTFNNHSLHFNLGNGLADTAQPLTWNVAAKYSVKGPYEKDRVVRATISYSLSPAASITLRVQANNYSPAYSQTHYVSNHLKWSNAFTQIAEKNFSLSFNHTNYKWSLGVTYNTLANYVYLDSLCTPKQIHSSAAIYSAFISKQVALHKFHFNTTITAQIGNTDYIHLPSIQTVNTLYFQDQWFKKGVLTQMGFDVRYFSSYYADAYLPAMGLYYWQNKITVGNYPFVDFFFAMKIKRANVFFKVEHLNSGFSGAYYLAPHLPAADRSIKVGINWDFFD